MSEEIKNLAMIDTVGIDIYRKNIFRITGLPVDASEKQIKRRADELKMTEEFGNGQKVNSIAYALVPPPSPDQIRGALQRLKEPEQRLIDEFFWFWPKEFGESDSDPAIQAMLAGDADNAREIWSLMECDPQYDFIASHNMAVTYHLVALDWTDYHLSVEVDKEREEKIEGYWKVSFAYWKKIATDERVWAYVKTRVRALNDPRLTTGFVRRMRDAFPDVIGKINAEAALRFAEQGRMDCAKLHIDFINEIHKESGDNEKIAALVLMPTRKRIELYIKVAKEDCAKRAEDGAEIAQRVLTQCSPLHNIFKLFYKSKSHHLTEIFDEVANTTVSCVVAYQKATGDNATFNDVLSKCLPFASSQTVKQRIKENLSISENNQLFAQLKEITESNRDSISIKFRKIKEFIVTKKLDDELCDTIAIVLRKLALDANNQHRDYRIAIEILECAKTYARSQEVKKITEQELVTARNNIRIERNNTWGPFLNFGLRIVGAFIALIVGCLVLDFISWIISLFK